MLIDKLKKMFSNKEGEEDGNNKRKLENIFAFVIILIVTIIAINFIINDGKSEEIESNDPNKRLATTQDTNTSNDTSETEEKDELVKNLENILSKINGVGRVEVMITYSETSKTIPVYNEESTQEDTEETDSNGGTRKITQTDTRKEVIYEEVDGNKTLITQSVISPTIEGAIITAEGASNATVKANIVQAVEAVTGIATHKIQVFEMAS